jgi:hypothetical protein
MGTLGDGTFYNFEKNTGYPEPWVLWPVYRGRMGKGNKGVYFHVHACAASVSKKLVTPGLCGQGKNRQRTALSELPETHLPALL